MIESEAVRKVKSWKVKMVAAKGPVLCRGGKSLKGPIRIEGRGQQFQADQHLVTFSRWNFLTS